jgi:hypothetical protein
VEKSIKRRRWIQINPLDILYRVGKQQEGNVSHVGPHKKSNLLLQPSASLEKHVMPKRQAHTCRKYGNELLKKSFRVYEQLDSM